MKIEELYSQWCKETKRGGAILIGGSIREFFKWLEENNYEVYKNDYFNNLRVDMPVLTKDEETELMDKIRLEIENTPEHCFYKGIKP